MKRRKSDLLVLLVALAFCAATIALAGASYLSQRDKLHDEQRLALEREATRLSLTVEQRMSALNLAMTAIANHVAQLYQSPGASPLGQIRPFLLEIARDLPSFRTIAVIDPSGRIRDDLRPDQASPGVDVSDQPYFLVHADNPQAGLFMSDPVVSEAKGAWTWDFSLAVRDPGGRLLAVVAASIDKRYFAPILKGPRLSDELERVLLHRDGTVLQAAHSLEPKIGLRLADDALIVSASGQGSVSSSHSARGPFGREGVLTVVTGSPAWPLFVMTLQDPAALDGQISSMFWLTLLVAGAVCLMVLTIAFLQLWHSRERAHAEAAFRENEARLKKAQEIASIGSWTWYLDDDGMINVSDEYLRIIGFPRDRPPTQQADFNLHIHPEDRDRATAIFDNAVATPSDYEAEYRFIRPDGEVRHLFELGELMYDDAGQPVGHAGTIQDITESRRAEQQLRQAQKMEAVGQLTGGVAHDFNNLLAVILDNSEILQETLSDDDGKRRKLLEAVLRAAERGADLTQRLLAFSRKQTLDPQAVDLNSSVAGMSEILRRTLGETIEIETEAAPDLWPCEVDPGQLENALLNLAVNARDAMPDGGRLTIETANALIEQDQLELEAEIAPGAYLLLTVTDTGIGMAPEILEHVFEPFFTTKDVGRGSGLGLPMVYGFAKQSGGHVTVSSEPGSGTTVKLYLPRSDRDRDRADRLGTQSEPRARGEVVLVVEDDLDVRTLSMALLDSLGYRVLEAGDGASATRALDEAAHIDLLLTDVVLPGGMSGTAVAREAAQRHPAIKVLYMSGYAAESMARHGKPDRGVLLLQKPFRRGELAHKVRQALDRPQDVSPPAAHDLPGSAASA